MEDKDLDDDIAPTEGDIVRAEVQFGVDVMGTHKCAMITEEFS